MGFFCLFQGRVVKVTVGPALSLSQQAQSIARAQNVFGLQALHPHWWEGVHEKKTKQKTFFFFFLFMKVNYDFILITI